MPGVFLLGFTKFFQLLIYTMEINNVSSDHAIAELIEMGFEFSQVKEAIDAVGPSLDNAVDFIINASHKKRTSSLSGPITNCSTSKKRVLGKRATTSSSSSGRIKQSSIMEHFQPPRSKRSRIHGAPISCSELVPRSAELKNMSPCTDHNLVPAMDSSMFHDNLRNQEIGSDWEEKVSNLLQKHFGFSCLKSFQKDALEAWLANQDSLVLAATGSGMGLST